MDGVSFMKIFVNKYNEILLYIRSKKNIVIIYLDIFISISLFMVFWMVRRGIGGEWLV